MPSTPSNVHLIHQQSAVIFYYLSYWFLYIASLVYIWSIYFIIWSFYGPSLLPFASRKEKERDAERELTNSRKCCRCFSTRNPAFFIFLLYFSFWHISCPNSEKIRFARQIKFYCFDGGKKWCAPWANAFKMPLPHTRMFVSVVN